MRLRTADGTAIEVVEVPGSGPWILLGVHDLPGSGEGLLPLAQLLRPLGRMVLPDLRGHGGSGGAPASVRTLADDLDEIRAAAGLGHPVLLGHGSGATVAVRAAVDQPWAWRALIVVAPPEPLPGFGDLDLPSLVVGARQGGSLAAALPAGTAAMIDGPTGVPWLDAPARLLQVVGQFLEAVDPGPGTSGIAPDADPR